MRNGDKDFAQPYAKVVYKMSILSQVYSICKNADQVLNLSAINVVMMRNK